MLLDKQAPESTLNLNVFQTFSNAEAAAILKVSIRTLQKYRDNGLIEFSQVGRKIVYTAKQLRDFLFHNKRNAFSLQNGACHGE